MNFASPRVLGFGDVRLAPLLGLALGWLGWRYVVLGFFAANLIGAVIGLSLIAAQRMKREQPVPYGVFLSAGAALAHLRRPRDRLPLSEHPLSLSRQSPYAGLRCPTRRRRESVSLIW